MRESIEQLIAKTIEESGDDEALMARSSLFEYYGHLVPAKQRKALAVLASFGSLQGV